MQLLTKFATKSSGSDLEYTLALQSDGKVPKIKVNVDNKPNEFVTNNGASVNIIDELTYRKLCVPLSESKIKLYAYDRKPLRHHSAQKSQCEHSY